ncbi:MAG TPA: four helix bundle protein [Candidatus Cloacimonetes bacterium]|jgi:four helix bundle protein|nr:four helix bundle protein [Candidatus Cloacimonadota bacterium]
MAVIKSFRDLIVYRKAFEMACKIYGITSSFPKEEKYSLTDQIRRSSRSVCANLAEAWARKSYPKAFVNRLSDALAEQLETEVWLDFCVRHKYIDNATYTTLLENYDEVRKILISMINKPENFNRDH